MESFDYKLEKIKFDCSIAMIDVGSGSDTKVMVKDVLIWSEVNSESGKLFEDQYFTELKQLYKQVETVL